MSEKWEQILKNYPEANFLQSPEYAKMNQILGDKTKVLEISTSEGKNGWALGIVRDAKRGRYLEIPCGPLIDWGNEKMVREAMQKITELARKEKCVFVRMRPQLLASAENLKLLEDLGLKKSPMHLAAEHTVMINLEKSETELLAKMRRQTRYEVRRARKLGITVSRDNSLESFREFHAVQAETARRQNFVPPKLETLLAEREAFGEDIMIYKAEIAEGATGGASAKNGTGATAKGKTNATKNEVDAGEKKAIAYGLVIKNGREGDYYEAASTELNRKLPGAYAILWQAMRDLKVAGVERFNLWGIAPAGQPKHRYAGVTTFKTGFGGEVVEFVPAHDLIISRGRYLKDLIVETVRKKRRHL